ncbi:hypothetical protein [Ollibium composti]|uniref:Uncharacterized protein n=1 Tax=Ollibium composti TaxID=2675109 RepID=A0ABY2QFI7_9HYPH|nr:hypothetical protein [Mesorhizobium composti]THF60017.1 hypothetical protein E6C48_02920 [Mesorhizobium composti]
MTIKMDSVVRWTLLNSGEVINFDKPGGDGERRVRLNLLLENKTRLYLENGDGPRLLAVAGPGRETIEYSIAGVHAVYPEPDVGEVYYQSAETEPAYAEVVDPVIFTKIAQRRHRNPELEEMMFLMNQNMERRLAQQSAEIEAAYQRRRAEEEAARAAETVVTDTTGAPASAGSGEVSAPVAGEPGPAPEPGGSDDGEPAAS